MADRTVSKLMLGHKRSKNDMGSRAWFFIPRVTGDMGYFADDRNRYLFSDILATIAEMTGSRVPQLALQKPDTAVDEFVTNYGMVLICQDHEGNKICYSTKQHNKLPQRFLDNVRKMGILPNDDILWADNVFSAPQSAKAREVIYGQRLENPARDTRARLSKKWIHPESLNQSEIGYLTGSTDKPPEG